MGLSGKGAPGPLHSQLPHTPTNPTIAPQKLRHHTPIPHMDDPRIGQIHPPPPPGPEPPKTPPDLSGLPHGRLPRIGDLVHFFPHRGHHPEWHFGPHAAIIIRLHPNDPRIANIYFVGPKGETGSYADIPHRSMRPECLPLSAWLGHAMPPSSHWAYPEESSP